MTLAESLFSNLTVNIKFLANVQHDGSWTEYKTKTDYTLWHVHKGRLWIEMNHRSFYAESGDVVLFYPGDSYKSYTDDGGCSFLVSFFTLETGNKMDLLAGRPLAGVYHGEGIARLCDHFCSTYIKEFQNIPSPALKQYASFVTFMAELMTDHLPDAPFHKVPVSPEKLPFHQILEYMNTHFLEPLPIRFLAEKMDMSEKYFIQYFSSHTGTSPKQYLVEKRMKHALILLADRNNSLSYTASRLGYSDQYAFSKAFKKYYGESPSSFRKQLR